MVAHPSSDGGKSSTTEQTDNGIAYIRGVLLGRTVIAFLGSLLARNPTRPPCLVLMLGGFFVLTIGALGLRGLTNRGAEALHSCAGRKRRLR